MSSDANILVNRSMPTCTVIPVLVYEDLGEASAWLCERFGFTERLRAGNHMVQLCIGDGAVTLTEQRVGQGFASDDAAELRIPRPGEVVQSVMVRVDDAHQHHEHARQRGARILQPPADHPFGERQYTAEISPATGGRSPSPSRTSLPRNGAAPRARARSAALIARR